MSYSKRNNFIKKIYKNCGLKTSSRSFCVCKELSTTSTGKWNFWSNPLILTFNSKAIKISPNQHAGFFRFLVTRDSLGLELVSRPQFPLNFLKKKNLFCNVFLTGQTSLPDCVYFPSYSIKCIFCFILRHLMSWHLKIWKFKTGLSQERKELSRWNKKHFFLFTSAFCQTY